MPLPFRILVLLAATCVVVAGCGDDRVTTTRPVGSDDEPETTTVAVRDDATPADAAPTSEHAQASAVATAARLPFRPLICAEGTQRAAAQRRLNTTTGIRRSVFSW